MSVGLATATIVSGVLLLAAVIMFVVASPTGTASFGWFAYQPLAGAAYFPGSLVILTPLMVTAIVVGVVGLVGVAAIGGYVLGRRRRSAS